MDEVRMLSMTAHQNWGWEKRGAVLVATERKYSVGLLFCFLIMVVMLSSQGVINCSPNTFQRGIYVQGEWLCWLFLKCILSMVFCVLSSRLLTVQHAVTRCHHLFSIDGLIIVRDEAYYNEIICKLKLECIVQHEHSCIWQGKVSRVAAVLETSVALWQSPTTLQMFFLPLCCFLEIEDPVADGRRYLE